MSSEIKSEEKVEHKPPQNELSWDLAEALIMIGNRKWETRELRKEGAAKRRKGHEILW